MKKLCIIVALLLALGLMGCATGSQTPDKPAAQNPDAVQPAAQETPGNGESMKDTQNTASSLIEPEQLISKQEAEQLLGEALQEGEKSEQEVVGQKICFYNSQNEDSWGFLQISLTQKAFMGNKSLTPESLYIASKEGLTETGVQEQVDGIGEEYFFGTPGLHILKDGYYLCVAVGSSNNEEGRNILKQAGLLAVENLGKILSQ